MSPPAEAFAVRQTRKKRRHIITSHTPTSFSDQCKWCQCIESRVDRLCANQEFISDYKSTLTVTDSRSFDNTTDNTVSSFKISVWNIFTVLLCFRILLHVGTGLANQTAAGSVIWQTRICMCTSLSNQHNSIQPMSVGWPTQNYSQCLWPTSASMPAVVVSDPRRTRRFFSTGADTTTSTHCTYPQREGQAEWARVARKIPGWH